MHEEEYANLLRCKAEEPASPSPRLFPLLAMGFLTLGYVVTMGSYCGLDHPNSCVPEVAAVPFIRPYVFQVPLMQTCVFIGSCFGTMTLLAFSSSLDSRIPCPSLCFRVTKWLTVASGLLSFLLLVLFSLAPSEERDFARAGLQTQANVVIAGYFVAICAHVGSAARLQEEIQRMEIVSRQSSWRNIRTWMGRVVAVLALGYFLTFSLRSAYLVGVKKALSHFLFVSFFFFTATYQQDLDNLELSLNYNRSDKDFKQLNRVTL